MEINKHSNVYPYSDDEIPGISLREYFAIKCLQPLIHDKAEWMDASIVKRAVVIADMLIEELNKDLEVRDSM